jgi:4-amino-4-deoxy-L-arabinose transferase-like glycosyltransferase
MRTNARLILSVTTSTDIAPRKNANELLARISWAALICATLYICYFGHLGAIGFVGPDEPRYAWIARDMAETGDWVTPRLYGKPWFEKPPLYYWGAAICFKVFGVSETAARLPSAISALVATLAMAWLAWRIYGAETARWLLLLLPTCVGMIGFSHAAATDMPFSAMLTIAMVCAAVVVGLVPDESSRAGAQRAAPLQGEPDVQRRRWLALILFGFFLGLAVLAKGPAGIILCGGALFFWALFSSRWREALGVLHPGAIAAFCVTALPWYILCARRNPDFFHIFIIEHNFKRYLTPEFQHIQPFWFYVPILLAALLPWTAMFAAPISDAWRASKKGLWRQSLGLLFVSYLLFTFLFFSISRSKLPGYILPAVFPLGLFLSQAVSLRVRNIVPGMRWMAAAGGVTLICLSLGIFAASDKLPVAIDYFPPQPLPWVALADFAAAIATLVLVFRRRAKHALVATIGSVVLTLYFGLAGDFAWALDLGTSARWAASPPDDVPVDYWSSHSATYRLNRSFRYGLAFYFHRELPEWSKDTSERSWIYTTPRQLSELYGMGLQCSHFMAFPPVVVCEVGQSPAHAPSGGKPQ